MFIGHHAIAFAAKSASPRIGLGTLFLATMWLDLVWPVLLLAGVEHVEIAPGDTAFTPLRFVSYPWSHSLLLVLAWSALVGGIAGAWARDRLVALVVGGVVLSHWLLDLIVHRPDLPLYPDAAKVGFGLWNSIPATVVLELGIYGIGVAMYARATEAKSRKGRWGFYGLVGFLLAIYGANLLGPPPETSRDIAFVGFAQWLLVLWAWWVDRNRTARQRSSPAGSPLSAR
jgi:hypothetical protein